MRLASHLRPNLWLSLLHFTVTLAYIKGRHDLCNTHHHAAFPLIMLVPVLTCTLWCRSLASPTLLPTLLLFSRSRSRSRCHVRHHR